MYNLDRLDLGTVKVHKKVLADIISEVLNGMEDVSLVSETFVQKLTKYFGKEEIHGIEVKFDDNFGVNIDVKVNIRFGVHIPEIAQDIQEKIKSAIHQVVDIQLKSININIEGIERGMK